MNENDLLVSIVVTDIKARGDFELDSSGVRSVLDQTWRNLQVIIVRESGSAASAKKTDYPTDARVELYELPRTGSTANMLNTALSYVKGDRVAFYRRGDIWDRDKIKEQITHLETSRNDAACFAWTDDEESWISGKPRAEWIASTLQGAALPDPYTAMVKADWISRIGKFDESYQQMFFMDWWLRFLERGSFCVMEMNTAARVKEAAVDFESAKNALLEKTTAYNEKASILSRWLDTMDEDLFIECFQKSFHESDISQESLEREKAFLLLNFPGVVSVFEQGLTRVGELLDRDRDREILKREYSFTQFEYYNLMKEHIYFDPFLLNPMNSLYEEKERLRASADYKEQRALIYEKEADRLNCCLEEDKRNNTLARKRENIEFLTKRLEAEERKYRHIKSGYRSVKRFFGKSSRAERG